MRPKVYMTGIGICLAVALLTSCGGEYAGRKEGDAVSGGTLRGEAVSGGAVNERLAVRKKSPEKDTYRFATDTNYYCDPKQGDVAIWQYRLDATKKKEIPLPHKDAFCSEVVCVEDGFLYYYINQEEKGKELAGSRIFRVPLRKDKDGYDIVDIDEREEILSDAKEILTHGVYMTSQYICYLRSDDWEDGDEVEVVKYDRKAGKKLLAETLPLCISADPDEGCDSLELCGYGDMLFVMGAYEICFQKSDETKWSKIETKYFWHVPYNENTVFDVEQNERGVHTDICKYDLAARQWQSYIPEQEWKGAAGAVLESGKAEQAEYWLSNMSYHGGRLYIEVIAIWKEGEVTHYRSLFLSKGDEDRTVCYDRGLGECVRSHVTVNEGKLEVYKPGIGRTGKPVVLEDAGLSGVINGKVFLSFYDYEKDEGRLGRYELSTGEFRWLAKEDAEYYEMCYGTHNDWQNYGYLPIYHPTWSLFDNILEGVFVL